MMPVISEAESPPNQAGSPKAIRVVTKGVCCPDCHVRLLSPKIKHRTYGIYRRRKCPQCKRRFTTIERLVGSLPSRPMMSKPLNESGRLT